MHAQGIVVLDKPAGISSNRALGTLKRLLGIRKMGFLGTLDPLATGVLPVFVGKATRLIPAFEGADKEYDVTVRLGERTDTLDAEGRVVSRCDAGHLTRADVCAAVQSCTGEMEQLVPAFSAVKHEGVPGYRRARQGQAVPEHTRRVRLQVSDLYADALPEVRFHVQCSAGTYVRALARDIGERLGVGAHVRALRRTRCGPWFSLAQALDLDAVAARCARQEWGFVLNPAHVLQGYRPLVVEGEELEALRHGQVIPAPALECCGGEPAVAPAEKVKAIRNCGTLVAIGEVVAGRDGRLGFRPTRVLI